MSLSDDQRQPRAATIVVRDSPDVTVEQASDDAEADDRVYIQGTAFHDGLNMNAWGLTESGAQAIADTLVGADVTASHPPLRDGRYDRSMHGGQGAPIGEVVDASVVTADQAMLEDGGYTANYTAEILDPTAKAQFEAGLRTGEDYGVSVGIYGNPEDAVCSVCRDAMAECDHDRFEEVEVETASGDTETQIAGPLYEDARGDHLASVFLPAYEDADVSVSAGRYKAESEATAAAAGLEGYGVPEAASQLGSPFDTQTSTDTDDGETDGTGDGLARDAATNTSTSTSTSISDSDSDYYVTF